MPLAPPAKMPGRNMPDGGVERRPGLDRSRLGRILGLLGSNHDGEALAAARMAERMRRDAGLTWPEIVEPAPPPAAEWADEVEADPIAFCFGRSEALTHWEIDFLRSIRRQSYPLTGKQTRVLRRLVAKCWAAP
jgi:hypothetical protein